MSDYCSDLSKLANKVKPLVTKTRTVAAVAATVGALSKATGTTWGYNEETNEFYEMTPMGDDKKLIEPTYIEKETTYGREYVNANIVDAWEALMKSDIIHKKYDIGNLPGIEGREIDETEYTCREYALDMVKLLNSIRDENGNKKFNAIVMNVLGTDEWGETVPHTVVKLEDRTNAMAYWIDPTAGIWSEKEETRLSSMQKWIKNPRSYVPFATTRIPITTQITYAGTILEPQTGQTGETGYDLTGTKMMLGVEKYTIEHTEELPEPVEISTYIYDEGIQSTSTTSIGKNRISRLTENYAPAIERMEQMIYDNNINDDNRRRALEVYEKDMTFTTIKQRPETEKENAKKILEKRKQVESKTKNTEELKSMYPIEMWTVKQ